MRFLTLTIIWNDKNNSNLKWSLKDVFDLINQNNMTNLINLKWNKK